MKKLMVVGILLIIGGLLFIDMAFAGVAEDRIFAQRLRIRQGILSGELTPWEIKVLKREQRHIRRVKKSSWFDGKLTYRESIYIERLQNRASRHIYRLKHNDARFYRRMNNSHWNRHR